MSFIGRQHELSVMRSTLERAAGGHLAVVSVVGEPGIGKSRLAAETAEIAGDFAVAWGRCWEAGGAPAYWPWTQALDQLTRAAPIEPAVLDELAGRTGLIGHVVASLRQESGPRAVTDDARFALFQEVAALLELLAGERSIMVIFDDLHAADRSSLLLLQFVARHCRHLRLALVCCYRDVEAHLDPGTGKVLSAVEREGARLALPRLDRAESQSLMLSISGTPSEALVDAVYNQTQGNPLFVGELSEWLRAQGWFERRDAPASLPIPRGVHDAIRQRLDGLSPETRELLEVAAAHGRRIDRELLRAVAGVDIATLARQLREAERLGAMSRDSAGEIQFSHIVMREALYNETAEPRRLELHAAIAAELERLFASEVDAPLASLAHHWLAAAPAVGYEPGVDVAIRSAERDVQRLAFEDAIRSLERALDAVDRGHGPVRLRCRLLIALAGAQLAGGAIEPMRLTATRALELAREIEAGDLFAEAVLAYGANLTAAVIDASLVDLLEEALAGLDPAHVSARARVLARLAAARQPMLESQMPIAMALEAIELAAGLDDGDRLDALYTAVSALMDYHDPRARLPLNLECARMATRLGDWTRLVRIRGRLIVDHIELGDAGAAWAARERLDELTGRLGQPRFTSLSRGFAGMHAMFEGRWADAETEMAAYAELGGWPFSVHTQRIGYMMARERYDELDEVVDALGAATPGSLTASGFHWVFMAHPYARAGRVERSGELLSRVDLAAMLRGADRALAMPIAEHAALAGDVGWARAAYDRLAPARELTGSWGFVGMCCDGVVDRSLALLAATLGDGALAAAHFESAIARLRSMGARPALARTLYDYGTFATPRDPAPGARLLAESRALATELDMPSLLARLGGAAPRVGAVADSTGFALGPDGDMWKLDCAEGSFHFKNTRGMRLLHRLIAEPGVEIHVLDLGEQPVADRREVSGDAGEHLDEEARLAYRRRLEELRADLDEAESNADLGRAARLREEKEFLEAELARAFGLGGRVRRAGDAAERARSAVQRRIKDAITRIGSHAPRLAAHLERAVKTGTFCSYDPTP